MPEDSKYLPADERRSRTVETVLQLAATQNPSEITTAAIAKAMDVTQGALFRHFASKEAIWEAVMDWVSERLLGRIADLAQPKDSPALIRLEAIFLAHIDFVAKHPGVPRLLFGELQRAKASPARAVARQLLKHYGQHLAAIIEQGKASGELNPALDTQAAISLFIGSIQGLVMQSLIQGGQLKAQASGVFAILRHGICNPGASIA